VEQLDLFAPPGLRPEQKARRTDPVTSKHAARVAFPRAGTQRLRILEALAANRAGLTYDDLARLTGMPGVSTSTRLSELAAAEWIERAGRRRTLNAGQADVWIATRKALEALRWMP
jgi:MarR family